MKKIKIILSLILMIGIMFAQNIKVNAGLPDTITRTQVGASYYGNVYHFPLQKDSVTNKVIFCTQIYNLSLDTNSCTKNPTAWDNKTASGVAAIIKEASSNLSIDTMTSQYYAATLAINKFLCDLDSSCTSDSHPNWVNDTVKLYLYNVSDDDLYRAYLQKAKEAYAKDYPDASVSISTNKLTFTLVGDNYVSNEFTISGNGYGSPTVTLNGTDANQYALKPIGPNSWQITIPKSKLSVENNKVKVTVNAKISYDYAVNYTCGNSQTVTYTELEPKSTSTSAFITGNITKTPKIVQIFKYNENGGFLPGVKLILKKGNDVIGDWTTGTAPKTFTDLVVGETYTVEEVEVPAGYIKINYTFTVEDGSSTQDVKIHNVKKKVQIIKVDQDGKQIAGAELVLKDSKGKQVGDSWISSDTKAEEFTDLVVGAEYTVEEKKVPKGYKKADPVTFTVENNTKVQIVKVTNEKEEDKVKKVIVYKRDKKGNVLGGAVLELYDVDNKKVVENWRTEIENPKTLDDKVLKIGGHYQIREVSAPEGYILNEMPISFTASKQDEKNIPLTFNIENEPNRVEITKIDADTKTPLTGVTLQLQYENGDVVKDSNNKNLEWVTTNNPYVIEKLPLGTYYVAEIKTINGYILNTERKKVTIEKTSKVVSVEIENKSNGIKIVKIDSYTKKPIAGIKLQIQNKNGDPIKDSDNKTIEWITTENPYIIEKLPAGTYYIAEIETVDGYLLNTERKKFTVKDTDEVVPVTFENKPTEVKITKINGKNKKSLVGAHLQVEDANGEIIDEWVSDENPHILRGLKNGKYYLVETEAPKGYEKLKDKVEFEVNNKKDEVIELEIVNDVPNTLSSRSTLLLFMAMFDIALGIGIVTYVKKNKVQE